jgi:hypothetical protein
MSPAERAQAVAMLSSAEAMRSQGAALMHLAEAQVQAANALLGAEPPADSNGAREAAALIFGEQPQKARNYGSRPNPPGWTQEPPPGGA